MAISKANSTQWLKRVYPEKVRMLMGDSYGKLLAMVRKSGKGFGESLDIGVEHGRLPSTGADFAKTQALATSTAPANKKFAVVETTHYTLARIQGNIIRKTKAGSDGIFKEVLGNKSRSAFNTEAHAISRGVYSQGYGTIGRIGSISTDTITLTNEEDAINFDIDMEVALTDGSGDDESAIMRDTGTALKVIAVDRSAGTVQLESVVSTITGAAAGDYIVRDGDRAITAQPAKLMPSGLEAWNPRTVAASGDLHFGVDRFSDVTRLAGHRLNALDMTEREAYIKATFKVMNDGATVSTIFTHPARFEKFALDLEGSKLFNAVNFKSSVAQVSIPGAEVMTSYGMVRIIPDSYCPFDLSFAAELDYLELRSEGSWPDFLTFDDGNFITVDGADQGEVRVGGDLQFVNYKPNCACLIKHDTAD